MNHQILNIVVHLILKMHNKLKQRIKRLIEYIDNNKKNNLEMIHQMKNLNQLQLQRLQLQCNHKFIRLKHNKQQQELKNQRNNKNKCNNNINLIERL